MKRYDRNQDGVLRPDEWEQMRSKPTGADQDGDQQITLEEFRTWLEKRFPTRPPSQSTAPPRARSIPFGCSHVG